MKKSSFLFFIVHPAKYHLFKNVINKLLKNGCKVKVLIISKDVLEDLVVKENWDYLNLFRNGRKIKFLNSTINNILYAFLTILKLFFFVIKNRKYDFFISDDLLPLLGKFAIKKSYFFVDNDYETLSLAKYILNFSSNIIAPSCTDLGKFNSKKISFKGNKAIAHLAPNYFNPNRSFLNISGDFYLIRVAILDALHDKNNYGINDEQIKLLIKYLEPYGKIIISSERKLNNDLEKYRFKIDPKKFSHYIGFAKMVITDSGTVATEAAVLGIPNLLLNNLAKKCGVHRELKNRYELQFYFDNFYALFEKCKTMVFEKNLSFLWLKKKEKFLSEIDDFNTFLMAEFEKNK